MKRLLPILLSLLLLTLPLVSCGDRKDGKETKPENESKEETVTDDGSPENIFEDVLTHDTETKEETGTAEEGNSSIPSNSVTVEIPGSSSSTPPGSSSNTPPSSSSNIPPSSSSNTPPSSSTSTPPSSSSNTPPSSSSSTPPNSSSETIPPIFTNNGNSVETPPIKIS